MHAPHRPPITLEPTTRVRWLPRGSGIGPLLRLARPGLVTFLLMEALLTSTSWFKGFGQFSGPDPYMRLARVLECRGGAACPGGLLPRSNVPFGEVLHWPFLLDRMILVLAAPLRPFTDLRTAVTAAGYLVGPLLGVVALLVLTAVARRLLDEGAARWVPVFASVQFWVLYAFAPVRPDHHGLQVLLFLVALLGTLRLITGDTGREASWTTAIGVGLAVWVSTEGLATIAPLLAALVLAWIVGGGVERARSLAAVLFGAAATLALGLFVDGPQPHRWAVEFDRFSVVHVTFFVLGAVFWLALSVRVPTRAATRAALVSVAGLVIAGVMIALFPGVQHGPMADLDPRLVPMWLAHVSEFVPASRLGLTTWGVLSVGPGLLGLAVAAVFVARRPRRGARPAGERAHRAAWSLVAGALLWFLVLSELEQVRWAHYVQVLSPLGLAALLAWGLGFAQRLRAPALVRAAAGVTASVLMLLWPVAVLAMGTDDVGPTARRIACRPGPVVETLSRIPATGGRHPRVLAPVFWGPELLFRADVDIVAGPYHRNAQGMLDSHRVMSAEQPAQALELLRERGIDYVVLCRSEDWMPLVRADAPGTLYHALAEGVPPEGFRSVPMPGVPNRFRLFRVVEPAGATAPPALPTPDGGA